MSYGRRIRDTAAGQARLGQSSDLTKVEPVEAVSGIAFIQEMDQPLELVGDPELYGFEPGMDEIDKIF